MNKQLVLTLLVALLCGRQSLAQNEWSSSRPDGHAPISVMGDHYHHRGEVMFSYRYMSMRMDGMLSGSDDISDETVLNDFMAVPQTMQMNMHMFGAMYAPSDHITLMAMVNYISNSMDLRTRMNTSFTTESSGIGDISLSALIRIFNRNRQSLHANAGLSLPTGSIDARDNTPMMENAQLAYPMQLGSGTFDPSLGLTYLGQADRLSWGGQIRYLFRVGENDEEYTFGNRFDLNGWAAYRISQVISTSLSLSFFDQGEIEGTDPDMNPMMMPLFDTANSGRNQLDLGIGVNVLIPEGSLSNLRFGAEFELPLMQQVNGIQMKNQSMLTLGLQYTIGH